MAMIGATFTGQLFLLLLFFPHGLLIFCRLSFGAPAEHLVTRLPGQPPVGFKQYAGYVNVDEATGTNLFYYLAEAEANSFSLPLTVWLNGGPGCSSIGGDAFTELGPFYPRPDGEGLRRNPSSWNKVSNVLFLESPAGVGWSYSDKAQQQGGLYNYDDWAVAKENLEFMRRWFERFPEYKHRQLFLAGESYAGHYIPQLATLLLKSKEFNLIGILVGNPLLNYGVDTTATYAFFWSHGVISDPSYMGVSRWCDFRYGYRGGDEEDYMEQPDAVSGEVSRVGEAVNVAAGGGGGDDSGSNKKQQQKKKGCVPFVRRAMREMGGYINIYDLSADVCVPPIHRQAVLLHQLMGLREKDGKDVCVDHEITRYLNQRAVQDALHANLTALPHPWEACSQLVNYTYIDKLEDMLPLLAHLAKEDLSIWVFSGDQDSVVPLTGTRSQITKLGRSLNLSRNAIYRPWYSHRQVGGGYESYGHGKIVYATVRGASHMVPFTQPVRALDLFSSLINGKTLPSQP